MNPKTDFIKLMNSLVLDENVSFSLGKTVISNELVGKDPPEIPKLHFSDLVRLNLVKSNAQKNIKFSFGLKGLTTEKNLQNQLTTLAGVARALDTSVSRLDSIEFMPPRDNNACVAYTLSGKADLTSLVRRMVFEVKDDEHKLCIQMMERVIASLSMSYLLSNSISIGATSTEGFICIGIRQDYTLHVHLFSVNIDQVGKVWELLTQEAERDASCFLTEDAPYVINALRGEGVDPWLCRVHLLGSSTHRVFDVTLPSKMDRDYGVTVSKDPDFCIKVVRDQCAYEQERKALDAVQPEFYLPTLAKFISEEQWVVIRTLQDKQAKIETKSRTSTETEAVAVVPWWDSKLPQVSGNRGIFFNLGLPVLMNDQQNKNKIFQDCMECLSRMHEKKYCHTDIRIPNIVSFHGKYTLIDYGEAVEVGKRVKVSCRTHKQLLPAAAQKAANINLKFAWKCEHDVEQLALAVLSLKTSKSLERTEELPQQKKRRY
jgi:hypothetical protein